MKEHITLYIMFGVKTNKKICYKGGMLGLDYDLVDVLANKLHVYNTVLSLIK